MSRFCTELTEPTLPACLPAATADNIYLTKADWEQYDLPIAIDAPNRTVLIHSGKRI